MWCGAGCCAIRKESYWADAIEPVVDMVPEGDEVEGTMGVRRSRKKRPLDKMEALGWRF